MYTALVWRRIIILLKTPTKDRPVKFFAMLTTVKGRQPWLDGELLPLQMAASDRAGLLTTLKRMINTRIVNSDDFNYRFGNIEASRVRRKRVDPRS